MYSIKIVLFYFLLSYDYLRITDENSNEIGKYCALLTGSEVFVGGKQASSVKISFGSFSPKKRICTHVHCRYAKYVTIMHNVVHLGPCKHRSNFTCDELDGNEQKLSRYYRVRRM